jgi:methionyl aminopeptidase
MAPAYFCGKVCFQAAWPAHKLEHKTTTTSTTPGGAAAATAVVSSSAQDPNDPRVQSFRDVEFTGSLRPYVMTPQVRVNKKGIDLPDYALSGVPVSEMSARGSRTIEVKTPAQIAALRRVCKLGREVLDEASAAVKIGVTADALDKLVFEACMERGCYPSPLNYRNFPKSVCISVNEVICHGIPDLRPLQDGDIVNLDVSIFKDGVHADLNETFFVGAVDADSRALVRTAYETLRAAVATVRPGTLYRDVGGVIEKVARAGKCSVVTSYCGHGIGTLFHCAPNVPHYKKNKAVGVMQPGHVFTIEPMINRGGPTDVLWPDQWTSVTRDGKRSAQFEHTLLVTDKGVEILTAREGEPDSAMLEFDDATFQR